MTPQPGGTSRVQGISTDSRRCCLLHSGMANVRHTLLTHQSSLPGRIIKVHFRLQAVVICCTRSFAEEHTWRGHCVAALHSTGGN